MPALSFSPALSLLTAFGRMSPTQPFRTFIRSTGYKLRPPCPVIFNPTVHRAQDAVRSRIEVGPHQVGTILREQRKGTVPTIVLGGFVPDATEQVYLMRGFLLKRGSVYYFNYPHAGFSIDMVFAQLDDLVDELAEQYGQRPVIFSVSFGVGLVMEWLKRARLAGRRVDLRGLVLISPVACVEDLLAPGTAKPTTLLGRAVHPFFDPKAAVDERGIAKARSIFTKMFEAGAANKESLLVLMTRRELFKLRNAVIKTIQDVSATGATERVQSMRQMQPASSYFSQTLLPLSDAPTLIMYAEKETSVIAEHSPTRFALESAHRAYFPNGQFKIITNHRGSPVQHASLIFHCFNFLPPISAFYRHLKNGKLHLAA